MMTPLPSALVPVSVLAGWRIDTAPFAATWDSGIGAERTGGRWNPMGIKAVYCSLDPATSIVEVAVHKGFKVLDTNPHVLTSMEVVDVSDVRVVEPSDLPNPAWLHGGVPSAGQQAFGADLLQNHDFVLFPSAVSKMSWNIVFSPILAAGKYKMRSQDRLVLDTRLNPPP